MANVTHTVVKGDTLYSIAIKYNTTVNNLVELNNISNPNHIVIGQVLIVSGEKPDDAVVNGPAVVSVFGLLTNTDRDIYAAWPSWERADTEKYEVRWYYDTGDAIGWIRAVNSTVDNKQSIYNGAPENAIRVRFVMRPVAKVDENDVAKWVAPWSEEKIYVFADNPPTTPETPSNITIDANCWMTIKLENLNVGKADLIEFQIAKRDEETAYIFHTGKADINQTIKEVLYSCRVSAGGIYKVRCRSVRGNLQSEWSAFSNEVCSIPEKPSKITTCVAKTATSVYLEWSRSGSADSYEVQYATDESYFDNASDVTEEKDIKFTHREITGLTSGVVYFFRVRAINDAGESGWSDIVSTAIGAKPTAPTTWSSKSTAIIGDKIRLNWVHNVEDGSKQTKYMLELDIDGNVDIHEFETEDEFVEIDTNELADEDSVITWRVKTAGITGEYCDDWSVARVIKVYVEPTISLSVVDADNEIIDTLTTFPFYIKGSTSPSTQKPIGYHVSITANESYDSVDNLGNEAYIKRGDSVYSEHMDINEQLGVEISANNISLENNVHYTITVTASFDSGLTAEKSCEFQVKWTSGQYVPNAMVNIDRNMLTAHISPYCENTAGVRVTDVYLSIYRREIDGRFTEIATNLDGSKTIFVTDPHPSLDYARYRIVSKSKTTGAISYYDMPGVKVGEKAAVIQWDEKWTTLESMTEKESSSPPWSGVLLKLPYNLDVSNKYQGDVTHVEYIGREHPVAYHGTQTGETSVWNSDVAKSDSEMMHLLHRLAIWLDNVYVREPSGSGYWATVVVSFGKKHKELTVPVTINITRVEGGI